MAKPGAIHPITRRLTALLALAGLLAALLPGCTRQAVRPPVAERHYRVDWEAVRDSALLLNGLEVRSALLTPTQYPLEASLKRLAQFDVVGVWEALDFRFQSSRIPEGGLQKLYDAGYLPVYVRVHNTTDAPRNFNPALLAVTAGEDMMPNVPPAELPRLFQELDLGKTVGVVVGTLFMALVLVASMKEGRSGNYRASTDMLNLTSRLVVESTSGIGESREPVVTSAQGKEPGLLEGGVMAAGEFREGFLLFRIQSLLVNWEQARLAWF